MTAILEIGVLVFWFVVVAVLLILTFWAVVVLVRDLREQDEDEHADIDHHWNQGRGKDGRGRR